MTEKALKNLARILLISILLPLALYIINSITANFFLDNTITGVILFVSIIPCGITGIIIGLIILFSGVKDSKSHYIVLSILGLVIGLAETFLGFLIYTALTMI